MRKNNQKIHPGKNKIEEVKVEEPRMYYFVPESINITAAEIATILAFCGLTVSEKALVQLPVSTRRHFKFKD